MICLYKPLGERTRGSSNTTTPTIENAASLNILIRRIPSQSFSTRRNNQIFAPEALHRPILRFPLSTMHFSLLPSSILLALVLQSGSVVAADEKPAEPCTIKSINGAFYDLRSLSALAIPEGKKAGKKDRTEDYTAKGYDIPYNFTLNICAPLAEKQEALIGVNKKLWHNSSAYYEHGGEKFSIGWVMSYELGVLGLT